MRFAVSRTSIAWLVVTGLLLALAAGMYLESPPANLAEAEAGPRFDLQGHRGARGREPENTLPAFEYALRTGVTTLEMDLQVTADGVVVVHHDPRLDPTRTRGPDGGWIADPGPPIGRLSFAELQRYDVGAAKPGSRVARRFPEQRRRDGVRVPSLDQVVALAEDASGGTIRYNLEIKLTPEPVPGVPAPEAFVAAVLEVIRAAGIEDRTTIQSFDWRPLKVVRKEAPEIARAYLTAQRDWLNNVRIGRPGASPWLAGLDADAHGASVPRTVAAAEQGEGAEYTAPPPWHVVWSPYYRDLREPDLNRARALGLKVVPWTVNDRDAMASLIELGVDGLITDYPARLRAVLQENCMPLPRAYPEAGQ